MRHHAAAASRRRPRRARRPRKELQEPPAGLAEKDVRVARREETCRRLPWRRRSRSPCAPASRRPARGLLRREDKRRPRGRGPLQDRPDQRVVRAAEDDRVAPASLSGAAYSRPRRLSPPRRGRRPRSEGRAAGGQRRRPRRRRRARQQLRVAAARDRRLGGEEPDAAVARREDGMRLRGEDADDRDREPPWSSGSAPRSPSCRQRRRASRRSLEVARDLGGEAPDLVERARARTGAGPPSPR